MCSVKMVANSGVILNCAEHSKKRLEYMIVEETGENIVLHNQDLSLITKCSISMEQPQSEGWIKDCSNPRSIPNLGGDHIG